MKHNRGPFAKPQAAEIIDLANEASDTVNDVELVDAERLLCLPSEVFIWLGKN